VAVQKFSWRSWSWTFLYFPSSAKRLGRNLPLLSSGSEQFSVKWSVAAPYLALTSKLWRKPPLWAGPQRPAWSTRSWCSWLQLACGSSWLRHWTARMKTVGLVTNSASASRFRDLSAEAMGSGARSFLASLAALYSKAFWTRPRDWLGLLSPCLFYSLSLFRFSSAWGQTVLRSQKCQTASTSCLFKFFAYLLSYLSACLLAPAKTFRNQPASFLIFKY